VIPVPGVSIGTPYGRRGPWWSCRRDSSGNGIHTGVDFPAPVGTGVFAARPGKAVWASHGSAFGFHQLEILPGDGTRDFYAHMTTRAVANGATVRAGQRIGSVGQEGNATGPHLHFERHASATGGWSCDVVRDPAPSLAWKPTATKPPSSAKPEHPASSGTVYVAKLVKGTGDSDSVASLAYRLRHHRNVPKAKRPPQRNDYGADLVEAVKFYQRQVRPKLAGPKDGESMSNAQAGALFGRNYKVVKK
jgi:cold shock CspA family protein